MDKWLQIAPRSNSTLTSKNKGVGKKSSHPKQGGSNDAISSSTLEEQIPVPVKKTFTQGRSLV